tara:strand:+ start:105 stop:479 length:375 start_codon:yes stop_codon:yes gene_type:complete
MNNKRRNFRSRSQKNNFRRRNGSSNSNNLSSINYNRNKNFNRNGSSNNIHSVEKTMQKFQQLAKDAQSSGDPVLIENYLQHADHYLRRFNELSEKIRDTAVEKREQSSDTEEKSEQELQRTANQ